MRLWERIAIVFVLLICCGVSAHCYSATRKARREVERLARPQGSDEQARLVKMLRLARIVQNSLRIEDSPEILKIAARVRDHLYRTIPLRRTADGFDPLQLDEAYLEAVHGDAGHICGGLATIYIMCLESQGIPARYVGIWEDNVDPVDGHATVEFWLGGRWVASDPTFNVMYQLDGRYLSYEELLRALADGKPVEVVTNGYATFPDRLVADYCVPLREWKYAVMHPAEVFADGKQYVYPLTHYPASWDGTVTMGGVARNVDSLAHYYTFIGSGLLR